MKTLHNSDVSQAKNPDGSYAVAEALTFVPGAYIYEERGDDGQVTGRHLEYSKPMEKD